MYQSGGYRLRIIIEMDATFSLNQRLAKVEGRILQRDLPGVERDVTGPIIVRSTGSLCRQLQDGNCRVSMRLGSERKTLQYRNT